MLTDFGEREPADLDEAEEPLGREQAVVLVRVTHVPIRRDERWHGVEHLGDLAFLGTDSYAKSQTLIPAALRPSAVCCRRGGSSKFPLGRRNESGRKGG